MLRDRLNFHSDLQDVLKLLPLNSCNALIQRYERGKFCVSNLWQTDLFLTLFKCGIHDELIVENSLGNIKIFTFKKQE